jgi:hypothetical protein
MTILHTWNISVAKELGSAAEVKAKLLASLPGIRGSVVGDDAGIWWLFVVHCAVRTRQDLQRLLREAGVNAKVQSVRIR